MPQTNMLLGPVPATPGMLFDEIGNCDIVTGRIASTVTAIVPGTIVELNTNGDVVPLQDSTTGGSFAPKIVGVVVYDPVGGMESWVQPAIPASTASSTFAGYPSGMRIPILRRGRIWNLWDGNISNGALPNLGAVNVLHSSTGAFAQGVVTTLAVSATAGHEIDILGAYAQTFQAFAGSGEPSQGTYTTPFGLSYSVALMSWTLPSKP